MDHPHILKLYDHYEDNQNIYMVLYFCTHGQLYQKIKKNGGSLDERLVARYISQIVSAIQYMHSSRPCVIHRDIKPENIMIDRFGDVKLGDFGWANYLEGEDLIPR